MKIMWQKVKILNGNYANFITKRQSFLCELLSWIDIDLCVNKYIYFVKIHATNKKESLYIRSDYFTIYFLHTTSRWHKD